MQNVLLQKPYLSTAKTVYTCWKFTCVVEYGISFTAKKFVSKKEANNASLVWAVQLEIT